MRITHLIYDDLGNPWLGGGGAVRAREIYRRLAPRHQITLICGAYPGAPSEERVDGIRILRVGSQRSYALSRLTYALSALRHLGPMCGCMSSLRLPLCFLPLDADRMACCSSTICWVFTP